MKALFLKIMSQLLKDFLCQHLILMFVKQTVYNLGHQSVIHGPKFFSSPSLHLVGMPGRERKPLLL